MAVPSTSTEPSTPGIDGLDFASMALDADQLARLVGERGECVLNWTTRHGHPVGVVLAYLYRNDRFWMTCTARRQRVTALTARPRCSVVLNRDGHSATFKGTAIIHQPGDADWPTLTNWFYPALSRTEHNPNDAWAGALRRFIDTPAQVIIEVDARLMVSFNFAVLNETIQAAIQAGSQQPRRS